MTSTLTYQPRHRCDEYAQSHATSQVARQSGLPLKHWREEANKRLSLCGLSMEELEDSFFESRFDGWDGYGAQKVEDGAFLRAKLLLEQLIAFFPAPTASASPHGTLTLEWIHSSSRRLIVSVGPEDEIAYAAIFGAESVNGVARFVTDAPREILRQLARLFFLH